MPADLAKLLSGKFVVFDGPDGCGKSTQLQMLVDRLEKEGGKVRRLREPGGTAIGDQIRKVLLSPEHEDMDVHCEMLLYMASRAQLVREQIRPGLASGEIVLSDRFASSTLAYQGGGGGMDVSQILEVAKSAVGEFDGGNWPTLTLVFDLEIEQAMARLNALLSDTAGLFQDRIEQRNRDYFKRVRENYLWQAKTWPERYRIIDASKSVAAVEKQVTKTLAEFFQR